MTPTNGGGLSRLRGIFFDLDNTLIDRERAYEAYLRELSGRLPDPFADGAALQAMRELDDRGMRDRTEFCRLVAERFPELGPTPARVWHDFAGGLTRAVTAAPEVVALVQRLAQRYLLAVVTNGSSARQREKLRRAGLSRLLTRVVISEEVGAEKPDVRIFGHALQQVGLEPGEVLFVGDDPARDVVGAHAAGMPCCWISHGRRFPQGLSPPSISVHHLLELEPMLAG